MFVYIFVLDFSVLQNKRQPVSDSVKRSENFVKNWIKQLWIFIACVLCCYFCCLLFFWGTICLLFNGKSRDDKIVVWWCCMKCIFLREIIVINSDDDHDNFATTCPILSEKTFGLSENHWRRFKRKVGQNQSFFNVFLFVEF